MDDLEKKELNEHLHEVKKVLLSEAKRKSGVLKNRLKGMGTTFCGTLRSQAELRKRLFQYKWFVILGSFLLILSTYSAVRAFGMRGGKGETSKGLQGLEGGARILHVSPDILKEYPIDLATLTEIEPSEEVLLPGHVQKDPTQTALVTARAQGRLTEVKVKEADDVKKGQVLAIIQSTEVAQAQSAHLRTVLRFELAQRQKERSDELFEHQVVSAKDHELAVMEFQSVKTELDASRMLLKHLNLSKSDINKLEKEHISSGELLIRSPIEGVVIERKAELGQSVSSEDSLFTIGKTDQVLIVLNVYEKDIPLLTENMPVEVLIPRNSGQPGVKMAKVARIAQEIDSTTRSANVWLEVKNPGEELKLGQAISARIQGVQKDRKNHKMQVVPFDAVHKIEGESIIFVKAGETDFEPRKIKTGWSSDRWMEIKSGLKSDEKIVSKGSFILKSEFLKN